MALVTSPLLSANPLSLPQRSVSASRQFIVYGTDPRLRGALCDVAEGTKSNLLALLRENDNWKTPIVVNAQHPQANVPEMPAAALKFSQTGFGPKLQLDLTIAADINRPAIEREFLRVILIEMIYRKRPNVAAGSQYVEPPAWLVSGVQALASQDEPAAFGELLKRFVADEKLISLQEFLQQRPDLLDSPSRSVHRAYSFALLRLLTDTPDGRRHLSKFITDIPEAGNDPAANLKLHFPILGTSRESAEKAWRANLIRLETLDGYESLTVSATERRLDELLRLRFPGAAQTDKFWALEQYLAFMRFPNRASVLKQLSEELMQLGGRANPLLRPVISEYQWIASALARGKTRGIAKRLAHVKNSRGTVAARMREIDDYLNWFEATQSQIRSETFAEYLRTADKPETRLRRRDPISVYLDALETQLRH
jgi:hypothetical protein